LFMFVSRRSPATNYHIAPTLSLTKPSSGTMDMNANSSAVTMMIPWLHFRGGDNLLFESLHPSSKGAITAACIVLIALALFERWVSAMRASLETRWRKRVLATISGRSDDVISSTGNDTEKMEKTSAAATDIQSISSANSSSPTRARKTPRMIAPFIAGHDIPRGAIHALQALLGYVLMLAVMTFQAAYLIAIVVGLGLGEVLFGRIRSAAHIL